MAIGAVTGLNPQNGFGFIASYDSGEDVSVHAAAIQTAGPMGLDDGHTISLDSHEGRDTVSAANLKIVT